MEGGTMGQVLHGSARTTAAVRRAIQHRQESLRVLAKRHGVNPKTVAKWKKRPSVQDERTGPKEPRSTVLSRAEEAIVVAFRRHTLLPLDDCLYALQATIPHLTRSSLHRCLKRHGISRLPNTEGDKPRRAKFKRYPIGYFPIDLAEVRTEQGKLYLLVAIDRTSKFAFVELHERAHPPRCGQLLARPDRGRALQGSYRAHRQRHALHGAERQHLDPCRDQGHAGPQAALPGPRVRTRLRPERCGPPADQASTPLDEWTGRAHEPHPQGSDGPAVLLRHARPVAHAPGGLRRRLQLRSSPQNPEGAHAVRVHLQTMDTRA